MTTLEYTVDLEAGSVDLVLPSAETVLCTFENTNADYGTINVIKHTFPADETLSDFSFLTTGEGYLSFSLKDGQTNSQNLLARTYAISEQTPLPDGWYPLDSFCVSSIKDRNPVPGQINLVNGEIVTCSFYNAGANTVAIKKVTVPPGADASFPFTNPASPGTSLFGTTLGSLKDTQIKGIPNVSPGTYWVDEQPVLGWKLTGVSCAESGANPDHNSTGSPETTRAVINLKDGEVILCTFINQKTDPEPLPTGFPEQPQEPEKTIPETGFPVGHITSLPVQSPGKLYSSSNMILKMPTLNVSIPIVGVPETEDGWDLTWLGGNAGYLAGSVYPTWMGNTVITAHVWDAYNHPGPFAGIRNMKYGDQFAIEAYGKEYVYEVRENQLIQSTDLNEIMQHEEKDWVTLVTCENYNQQQETYTNRRMVRAILVQVN